MAIGGLVAGLLAAGVLGWAAGPALASTPSSHHGHIRHDPDGKGRASPKKAKSHSDHSRDQGDHQQKDHAADQKKAADTHQSASAEAKSDADTAPAKSTKSTEAPTAAAATTTTSTLPAAKTSPSVSHKSASKTKAVKSVQPAAAAPAPAPAPAATVLVVRAGSVSGFVGLDGDTASTVGPSLLGLGSNGRAATTAAIVRSRPVPTATPAAKGLYNEPMVLAAGPWRGLSMQAATKLSIPILFGVAVAL
ncbi:MAG TPA: hypothetical protein VGL49_07120, partial [Acidimicrobiales bacterium]